MGWPEIVVGILRRIVALPINVAGTVGPRGRVKNTWVLCITVPMSCEILIFGECRFLGKLSTQPQLFFFHCFQEFESVSP